MKKFFLIILSISCLLSSANVALAEELPPKEGDIIQISTNGYDIRAKIISVTPPQSVVRTTATPEPEPKPEPAPTPTPAPAPKPAPTETTFFPGDIQKGLDNFAASNPIKSGIATLNKKIAEETAKWYSLALGKTGNKDKEKQPAENWTASALNAITPYVKDIKSYWYLGVALICLIILFLLWRGKRRYDRQY